MRRKVRDPLRLITVGVGEFNSHSCILYAPEAGDDSPADEPAALHAGPARRERQLTARRWSNATVRNTDMSTFVKPRSFRAVHDECG